MPSLEWFGHVPTAVSAVHALVALVSLCRRSPAGHRSARPGATAKPAVQEQCACGAQVAAVLVEVAVDAGVVVRVAVDARTPAGVAAPAGAGAGGPAIGGERGPW